MGCVFGSGFQLQAGYPTWDVSLGNMRAVIKGTLPWDQWYSFIDTIFPPSSIIAGVQNVFQGALFPGSPLLRATNMRSQPINNRMIPGTFDPVTGFPEHEGWDIEITYELVRETPQGLTSGMTAGDPTDPTPYLIHRWSIGGDVIVVSGKDGTGLCWDHLPYGDPSTPLGIRGVIGRRVESTTEDVVARKTIPLIEHEITWPRIIRPPYSAIRNCLGNVNGDIASFKTGKIQPECLLMTGAQIQNQVMANGTFVTDMVYRFSERVVECVDGGVDPGLTVKIGGWNHFFRNIASKRAGYGVDQYCDYGVPGFYRLEKMVLTPSIVDCSPPGDYGSDLQIGYQDKTAIYLKRDFSKLFKPEPPA